MKQTVVLIIAVISATALGKNLASDGISNNVNVTAVNELVDSKLQQLGESLGSMGGDPAILGDITRTLNDSQKLQLKNGSLRNISSLYRNQDVKINATAQNITYDIPIGFGPLLISYNDSTVNAANNSGVTALTLDFKLNVRVEYDSNSNDYIYEDTSITDSGSISVKVTGNDLKRNTVTLFLHSILVETVTSFIAVRMADIVDQLNDY